MAPPDLTIRPLSLGEVILGAAAETHSGARLEGHGPSLTGNRRPEALDSEKRCPEGAAWIVLVPEHGRRGGFRGRTHVPRTRRFAMSKFVYLFRTSEAEQRQHMGTPEQAQKTMEGWLVWVRGLEAKGHLVDTGQPLAREGKVVRGKGKVTDGPFVEAKDLVAGFMIVEARDLDHAVELSKSCPMLGGQGSVEVRPVSAPF